MVGGASPLTQPSCGVTKLMPEYNLSASWRSWFHFAPPFIVLKTLPSAPDTKTVLLSSTSMATRLPSTGSVVEVQVAQVR
jgi:hypothetical protein